MDTPILPHSELPLLPATELARLIRERRVSPVEVVDAVLARIDVLKPAVNGFVTVCHEHARERARAAEAAVMRGDAVGPLHGVPYTAKDLVNTRAVRTTYGSRVHEHFVPPEDAVAVARLDAAGAILVGKTTTPEFGHKPWTDAPLFGVTHNPWNPDRSPGGSSGGAAAVVALGLAPLAIATDGGGSTRIPAACTGVVGFKQSIGVVPHSQAPDVFANYTYVTPMTRTVGDTALMLRAMSGPHPVDPWSHLALPDWDACARPRADLAGLRVGWTARLGNAVVARDVEAALQAFVAMLAGLGARIEPLGEDFEPTEPVWRVVNHSTWAARFRPLVAAHEAVMSPTLVRQVREAEEFSAVDLQNAAFARTRIFRTVQRWFERFDLVVTPTLSRTALPVDGDLFAPIEIDGVAVDTVRKAWYPYTLPFNLTGHPAVSMPAGAGADGLPIGVQLVGGFHGDAELLSVCATVEAARPPLPWPALALQ